MSSDSESIVQSVTSSNKIAASFSKDRVHYQKHGKLEINHLRCEKKERKKGKEEEEEEKWNIEKKICCWNILNAAMYSLKFH